MEDRGGEGRGQKRGEREMSGREKALHGAGAGGLENGGIEGAEVITLERTRSYSWKEGRRKSWRRWEEGGKGVTVVRGREEERIPSSCCKDFASVGRNGEVWKTVPRVMWCHRVYAPSAGL